MKYRGHAILLACLLALTVPTHRAFGEWTADIVDSDWSPTRFVAVDKKSQSFSLLVRQSPLRVAQAIPCATGQELGDKFKEGDLKTPEGVYFITQRKNAGLNYELYGDLAFVLNFPNPMDVLRRKSGHGIWIHGRGHPIIPYETQGCVALNTPDIHRLDQVLAENMPVVIADEIQLGGAKAQAVEAEGREVVAATQAWAKAWQDRSEAFFGFHDPEKFAITEGQPFAAFRIHKERLFKALPWIQVTLFDVRAVPGPDYWVTYFIQVYRSPTLISQGVKRLYWQRNADGRFRIVGMEYEETPVTLADKNGIRTNDKALAAAEHEQSTPLPEGSSEEETQVRQLVDAQQPVMEKMAMKAFHTLTLHRPATPEDQTILEVAQGPVVHHQAATDAVPVAPAPPQPQAQAPAATPAPVAPAPALPASAPVVASAAPAPTPAPAKPDSTAAVAAMVESWRTAWERGQLDAYMNFYVADATQGNLRSKAAIRAQKARLWSDKAPARVTLSELTMTPKGQGFVVDCLQQYQGRDGGQDTGRKRLLVVPAASGFRIAEEIWTPGPDKPAVALAETPPIQTPAPPASTTPTTPVPPVAPPAPAAPVTAPASVQAQAAPSAATPAAPAKPAVDTAQARALVEAWRAAWEQGHLDAFLRCYAPDVVYQGGRRGRGNLRAQKAKLWETKPPKRVTLTDVVVTPEGGGFTAQFAQEYESRDGARHKGRKTLVLTPTPDGLVITQEKWSHG
jgi:murein L,D-transpeptidase YafK